MNGAAQDVLKLPGALDLAAAESFLETIRQHLKLDRALCLDASDVETLTLPCIQIILAAVTNYEVLIVNPSDAFASAFRDLALDWDGGQAADGRSEVACPPSRCRRPNLCPCRRQPASRRRRCSCRCRSR